MRNRDFLGLFAFLVVIATIAAWRWEKAAPAPAPVHRQLVEIQADTLDHRKAVLRCMASWYSSPEHGRPTASGEIFDSTALTAALYRPFLRQAPYGSQLLVQCPWTWRCVVVRITDAMPSRYAREGRMLDLSRAAAESLGMVGTGVFPVECWIINNAKGKP